MFYKHEPPLTLVRHHCRNPRCAGKLKTPEANPRDAFCCKGCERQFYRFRCRVCEQLFSRKTERRVVCGRDQCRYQFKANPDRFFGSRYISAQNRKIAPNDARSAHLAGLKSGPKSGRGWRIVAGPTDIHPLNLQAFPADAVATRTGRPSSTLIGRTTPPANIVGGYKFPGAPTIDLFEEDASNG